ncbi:MAG: chromosome segregation protein SMC [Gammaproteobacteria bacterium]|nr:MAG: chromosome segregation protein SMC [Gammaproteobacteria bacterium]
MRLKQIKLAGFKSFVDPTIVPFPDNLTAIVGPNGCGKSNLIDAVRWVLGESSAKNLRGDSMTDVIFNGSTARKPIGQASIELTFDNSDGTITGEYAGFNEISVRRQVNRDAQSNYSLNGTSCRKKDITNIFLGTGLGPRSYAIIEQGMISRLIESKPHELRVFIEEAAGISKYKERRRETENRIRHTRDNLDRLSDIRDELGRQLAHLQRQANSAEKYRNFKGEERQLKSELIALRWQGFSEKLSGFDSSIKEMQVELESKHADQRSVDSEIEISREKHIDLTDSFNEVQGRFYGVGAEIARLEQSIKHSNERRVQLEEDLSRLDQAERNALQHLNQDQQLITEINKELAALRPDAERLEMEVEQASESLQLAEEAMQDWQQDWDNFQQTSAQINQRVEVEQTRIQHSELLLDRSKVRLNNFQAELAEISVDPQEEELKDLTQALAESELETEAISEQSKSTRDNINKIRQNRDDQQSDLSNHQQQLQQLQGREVTLKALQKAALGTDNEAVENWLNEQDIDAESLAEQISVKSGWELAVETVLGKHLEALTVNGFDQLSASLENLQEMDLSLVDSSDKKIPAKSGTISSMIESDLALPAWLNLVYTAENLAEALNRVKNLSTGESLITCDGFWIGSGWLQVARSKQNEDSVLTRENELRDLSSIIATASEQYSQLETELQSCRDSLKILEVTWQEQQQQVSVSSRQTAELSSKVNNLRASLQHNQGRWTSLTQDIADLEVQRTEETEKLAASRFTLEESIEVMADNNSQQEEFSRLREERRNNLEHCRRIARDHKETYHRSALRTESLTAQLESALTGKIRAESQIGELGERRDQLQMALAEDTTPIDDLQSELETTLEKHQRVEKELTEARLSLETVDHEIRSLEGKRQNAEQNAEAVRQRLESLRMEWQGIKVRLSNEEDQLKSSNTTVKEILEQLADDASEALWEDQLEKIAAKIQRLGAINLAAIDEYKVQSERKAYLDSQDEDLCKALETLENAIRKIDKETRNRFQETFEKINKGLQELFPKVFGGGHAYLELTGDDLLDTGVTVMARPPGKRNSTIHLLSGGEKALTAISLVFSIFQLKPAPFCMLDEVDASLDDANVARFCRLVKEMSKTVQFIYISHNKGAIEMAHHLAGVTMQEAGVSRMVSVDLEEATNLSKAKA